MCVTDQITGRCINVESDHGKRKAIGPKIKKIKTDEKIGINEKDATKLLLNIQ